MEPQSENFSNETNSTPPNRSIAAGTGSFLLELIRFGLLAIVIVLPIRAFVAQPFIVSGASMETTFETGEYLIVDQLSYHLRDPKRGEVIIFRYPRNPEKFYIKRIIGLPNETIAIKDNKVLITNGIEHIVTEPYVVESTMQDLEPTVLGVNEYFVMGDNRPQSSDSRVWGPVPEENIIGRAFVRLFPVNHIGYLPGDYQVSF